MHVFIFNINNLNIEVLHSYKKDFSLFRYTINAILIVFCYLIQLHILMCINIININNDKRNINTIV